MTLFKLLLMVIFSNPFISVFGQEAQIEWKQFKKLDIDLRTAYDAYNYLKITKDTNRFEQQMKWLSEEILISGNSISDYLFSVTIISKIERIDEHNFPVGRSYYAKDYNYYFYHSKIRFEDFIPLIENDDVIRIESSYISTLHIK